jgi:Domain of unknown function (DUF3883)
LNTLVEIIETLGAARLGEINLLLNVMMKGPRDHQTVAKDIFGISGLTDQMPQPDLYITLALSLGLLVETEGALAVTRLGHRVYEESFGNFDAFAPAQIHLMLPEILGHPELRQIIAGALECFEKVPEAEFYRLREGPASNVNALGLQLLQTCQVTYYDDSKIIARSRDIDFVKEILGPDWAMTEDELWEVQAASRKRGKAAEEYIVELEKARLKEEGKPELAEMVNRVSATNARSAYDISSFNSDASPRFIEVKSSITANLTFYWTESERRLASAKGQSYWLYYVPRSQDLPRLEFGIIIIQDPMQILGTDLNEEPVTYRVTTKAAEFVKVGSFAGIDVNSLVLVPGKSMRR